MSIERALEVLNGGALVRPAPPPDGSKTFQTAEHAARSGMPTIGVLGNRKPNALPLLTGVANRIAAERGYQPVAAEEKVTAAVGADPETIDRLGKEADLVLVGSGD